MPFSLLPRSVCDSDTVATMPKSKARKADAMKGPSCGAVRRGKAASSSSSSTSASAAPSNTALKSPFPDFRRPTEQEARAARDGLAGLHGEYQRGERGSVVDSLVKTMLSQNTTDITSARAFAQLKEAFDGPDWDAVRVADVESIAAPIKCCGLADIRAARIKAILEQLHRERGETSMEYVRDLDDEAVKKELTRFKGVGPKTAAW